MTALTPLTARRAGFRRRFAGCDPRRSRDPSLFADGFSPRSPTEQLVRAHALLAADSDRLGDVLAGLLTLPQGFAESELALRLKLFAFGQLGYKEDYDSVAAKVHALSSEANHADRERGNR